MKKSLFIFCLSLVCFINNILAQCTLSVPTGVAGFSPNYNSLPCIERGVSYNQTIEFEIPPFVFGSTIEYLRIDSIKAIASNNSLLTGINWAMSVPVGSQANTLLEGQKGCINFSGITNDNAADYKLVFYVCTRVIIVPNEICDNLCSLNQTFEDLGTTVIENSDYYLRVINAGDSCLPVNNPDLCSIVNTPDSINSVNVFASDNSICVGDTIDLFVNHLGGPAPYTYTWSNGAGNVNATTVFPLTTTTYLVTVTDANGNSATGGIIINVNSQPSNNTTGTVRLSSNDSVSNMKVLLVQVDNNFNVSAVDSSFTDASGNFSFNYSGSNLFVKAIPDSTLYPFEMPTYHYGDTEAFPFMMLYDFGLSIPNCGNDNLFFNTIAGNNPGGSGFISGNIFQGAGKQQNDAAVGQYVFLVNSNNEPVDYSITNNDGYFSFSNIALADYRIFVDVPNFNINAAPSVSLNSNNPTTENIQYYLEDLVSSVVLKPFTKINEVQLYPNPSKGQFIITSEFNTEVKDIVLNIMDIQGKVVSEESIKLNGKKLESLIDLSTHQKGCYFIQLKANEVVVNKKLMLY